MTSATIGLSFQEVGIADALSRWALTVPLNQRSYEWEDQIERLLTDLYRSFDRGEHLFFGNSCAHNGQRKDSSR